LLANVQAAVPVASRKHGAALLNAFFPPGSGQLLSGKRLMAPDGTISASAMAEAVSERLPVIRATAAAFATRYCPWKSDDGSPEAIARRYTNPLVVTQSSPGCGKTLFLQTLACLITTAGWTADICPDADTVAMLNASVPVYVAYNDAMPQSPGTYDSDDNTGLATRILYSFFVDPAGEPVTLDKFYARLQAGASNKSYYPDPHTAVNCCLYALWKEGLGRVGIVLLADDADGRKWVPRSGGSDILSSPLVPIGRQRYHWCPSQYKAVAMVLDGDDYGSVIQQYRSHETNVPTEWVHLAPIAQAAAERMLCAAVCPAAGDGVKPPRAVRIAISDACGHARTLEYVRDAWAHLTAAREAVTVPALHALVQRRVVPVGLAHVTTVLAGRIVPSDEPVHGDTKGVQQRIVEGLFVYAKYGLPYWDYSLARPYLTVYQLSELGGRCGAARELGNAIDALLAAGTDDDVACGGGTALESFLAAWLRLRVVANNVHRHYKDWEGLSNDTVPAPALTVDHVWCFYPHDEGLTKRQVARDTPVWTAAAAHKDKRAAACAGARASKPAASAASFAFHVLTPRPGDDDAALLTPAEVAVAMRHAGVHVSDDMGAVADASNPVHVVVAPHRHNDSLRERNEHYWRSEASPGPWDHLLRNGIITVDYTQLARALGPMLAARAFLLHKMDTEWRAAAAAASAAPVAVAAAAAAAAAAAPVATMPPP